MLVSMCINLYTSRLILKTLGTEDFGIYNVVASFVIAFGFLNSAMNASTQRFLTLELGKNDMSRLGQIFKMSMLIHILISLFVIVIAESIGSYLLNFKLNIPSERLLAANYIFQFSLATLVLTILSVPYNAVIVARERMGAFAIISLIEVCLKLLAVVVLQFVRFDKLIIYGLFLFIIAFTIRLIYNIYCVAHFPESKFGFYFEPNLFKNMFSFAGWNLIGVFAGVSYNQGVNILLNIFGGPIVNAARGIAFQVSGAINQLVSNFQLAVNPPIIKSYAQSDVDLYKLVYSASKYSYVLLLFLIVPLSTECEYILHLWLYDVPQYTIAFTRLAMIDILICSLSGALHTLVQATGDVKRYQIIISGILLLNLPLSYVALRYWPYPQLTFVISIILSFCALFARLMILSRVTDLCILSYVRRVIVPISVVSMLTPIFPSVIRFMMVSCGLRLFYVVITSSICILVASWFIVLSYDEKKQMKSYIKKCFFS